MRKGWCAAWCGVPAFWHPGAAVCAGTRKQQILPGGAPVCEISVKMWKSRKNSAKMGKKKEENTTRTRKETIHTMESLKILVVDDEARMRKLVKDFLTIKGFTVIEAEDGEQAVDIFFKQKDISLIILDVMMPRMDGWQVVKEIREYSQVPIIMLTAKGEVFDKVLGLELGADDYVVKPFETKEVIARINAVLRRIGKKESSQVKEVHYENLSINLTNYELKVKGVQIDTPPKEMELIYHLASNPNRVFTRDQLLDEVWGFEYYGDSRTVDVHVKRLREKLEGVSDKWSLKTVWGVGYKFEVKE